MSGNQVVLTFAGETKNLEDGFDRVGGSAKKMSDKAEESADGFKKVGEAADEVDTKAMGFRDTLTGLQDTMKGTAMLAKGPSFEGFLTLGAGIGDLGSGMFNFLVPAFKSTITAIRAMNLAFLSSPVFWIIAAIVILIGVIVLIATKTDWFQRAWRNTWKWVKSAASDAWDFIKKIPGWLQTAFARVAGFISAPYRAAFNLIATAWNNTIGRLHFTLPDWIPGIGGNSISVPNLPHFHSGGTVPGAPGSEMLAVLQAGERISPATSSGGTVLEIHSGGSQLDDLLVEILSRAVRRRGGNVQLALGGRNA
jgi:hypothetical protein